MSKWIDYTIEERKTMVQTVSELKQIDEASVEKDWWVTAVLYAVFHTSIGSFLSFKGGTSLSKDGVLSIVSAKILTLLLIGISS